MKRQENRAVLAWRGAVSAGLVSTADRAYMKAPVPRSTLRLVDKVSRSCGYTPGKVTGQRVTDAPTCGQSVPKLWLHSRKSNRTAGNRPTEGFAFWLIKYITNSL